MSTEKNYFQEYKDFLKAPKTGDVVKGKVIQKGKGGIFLDLENFKIGVIKKDDLAMVKQNATKIQIGDEIIAKIINIENEEGFVELSLKEASEEMTWKKLEELKESKGEITLKPVGANKGGLIFNLSGVQGFLPASQLSAKHYPKLESPTPDKVFEELKKLIGKELKVKILNTDSKNGRLILSEK